MKSLSTTLLFLAFLLSTLNAQHSQTTPRNIFQYGFGTSYLSEGNYFGRLQHFNYQRGLFKRTYLELDGGFTRATQNNPELEFEKKTNSYQLAAGLQFALFENSANALKLGGGGSWRYAEAHLSADDTTQYEGNLFERVKEYPDNSQFGFNASLEYNIYVARHLVLGSRFRYSQFQNGEKTYDWGLSLGFRF